MKTSFWDILTTVLVFGIVIIALGVLLLFINPSMPFNPFPPQGGGLASLFIPTSTPTPRRLPPTWTPTSRPPELATATRKPTSTAMPTSTPFVITPFVLPSPTLPPKSIIPTNSRLPLEGKCKIVSQSPEDGTSFRPDTTFTTRWILQNTSDTNWPSDGIDVKYKSGESMHTGKSAIDLPRTIVPGDTFEVTVTMISPKTTGFHITYWVLMEGLNPRCTFYVEIFTDASN